MQSFFEIGGELVELHHDVPAKPRGNTHLRKEIDKVTGSKTASNLVIKVAEEKTGVDLKRKYTRYRRARWAVTTAGTLAAADGPLPVGDAIAIGFLGAYGAYETYKIITEW